MSHNARITVRIRPAPTRLPLVLRGSDDQFLAVVEELTQRHGVLRARGWTIGEAAGLAAKGAEREARADQPRSELLAHHDATAAHPDREACGFDVSLPTQGSEALLLIRSRGRKHYFQVTV